MLWKMTDEPEDYEGPWPSEGKHMTIDDVMTLVRSFGAARLRCATSARNHRYEDAVRAMDAVYDSIRGALEALAAPHKADRWNIDVDDSDGSLLICKGEHDKDEKCETVRYVPASPRPDAPDLYLKLHGLSKLLEGRGRIDEGETPDAYSTILDAMALARGPAPTAPESKGALSMDGKPAAPVAAAPARREDMEAFAAELRADHEKAKRFFTQAGIIGVGGKLTPAYGGQEQAQGEPISAFQRSAPERIWLSVGEVDDGQVFDDVADGGDEWAPWILQRDHRDDVPYVRADLAHPPRVDAEVRTEKCHYSALPDQVCNKCGQVHGYSRPKSDEEWRLRETLHQISLCSQNSMSSKDECGRIARRALEGK